MIERASGILLPIFSLPSDYGIGTFGSNAYEFVDYLKDAGVKYWQILPIHPVTAFNSPYQSTSTYAGSIYFIDLNLLCEDKLLKKEDFEKLDFGDDANRVDYEKLRKYKRPLLFKAASNFKKNFLNLPDYKKFKSDYDYFLTDYAVFSLIRERYGGLYFSKWDKIHRLHYDCVIDEFIKQNESDLEDHKILQYFFFKQWLNLKKYANDNGVKIIGDMPIYSSLDSVEVFCEYKNFLLSDDRHPYLVAGCPPDAFSSDGQLWHNPLYDYDYMKKDNYKYFVKRMSHLSKLYDVIRIDHFRGFANYFAIDSNATTARDGKWMIGPGKEIFDEIEKNVKGIEIIAEDLGYIDEPVIKLLNDTGYPGMKVVEFAFGYGAENHPYLPKNHIENSVAYLGTHDNDTFVNWFTTLDCGTKKQVIELLNLDKDIPIDDDLTDAYRENLVRGAIKELFNSKARLAVILMQDLLALGKDARINTPSTVTEQNWSYRFSKDYLNDDNKKFIKNLIRGSKR